MSIFFLVIKGFVYLLYFYLGFIMVILLFESFKISKCIRHRMYGHHLKY